MNDIVVSLAYVAREPEYGVATAAFGKQSAFLLAGDAAAMVALKVGRKSLERRYSERTRDLLKEAVGLPDRPSPGEIHDLRVTARRIQMMRSLLPRSVRGSQDSKRYDFALKSVLKATSQLRDMDTLLNTLDSHKGSLPAWLLVNLGNQRSDAAARAKAAVSVIAEVPTPEFDASMVGGRCLSKKLRKRVRKHSKAATTLLAEVLNDESKAVELHSLRKEVKKTRYLVELADKVPARLTSLTKWQDALGAIHDLDVAVSFLEGVDADSKRGTIVELKDVRHSEYLKFVRECRSGLVQALGKGGTLRLDTLASGLSPAEA